MDGKRLATRGTGEKLTKDTLAANREQITVPAATDLPIQPVELVPRWLRRLEFFPPVAPYRYPDDPRDGAARAISRAESQLPDNDPLTQDEIPPVAAELSFATWIGCCLDETIDPSLVHK
jgi:hypothetical protein